MVYEHSKKYESVVSHVIRDLFMEKRTNSTLENIVTASDVAQHNLVDDRLIPGEEEEIKPRVALLSIDTCNTSVSSVTIELVITNQRSSVPIQL